MTSFSPRDIDGFVCWYDCGDVIVKNDKVYIPNLTRPLTWWRKFRHKVLNWPEKDTIVTDSYLVKESIGYDKSLNKNNQKLVDNS